MTKKFLSGSEAAAYGAKLSRVEVIAAYPISPNTGVIAALSDMVEGKELDAELVNVEGEHSAASVCSGAVSAGSRSFTEHWVSPMQVLAAKMMRFVRESVQ